MAMVGFLAFVVGAALLLIGLACFSPEGLSLGGQRRLKGRSAKVLATFCVVVGLLLLALAMYLTSGNGLFAGN